MNIIQKWPVQRFKTVRQRDRNSLMTLKHLRQSAPDIAARAFVALGMLAIPACAVLLAPDRIGLVEMAMR